MAQGFEKSVDLVVGADTHPQPLRIPGIAHQPEEDAPLLGLLERCPRRRTAGRPYEIRLAVGHVIAEAAERGRQPGPRREHLRPGVREVSLVLERGHPRDLAE